MVLMSLLSHEFCLFSVGVQAFNELFKMMETQRKYK